MNKTIRYILVGALSLSTLGLSSCNKFLDVQPKGTLTEDAQFSSYEGYQDAVYGVYGTMAGSNLYGGPMTYSLLDKFGQLFKNTNEGSATTEEQILRLNYSNAGVRSQTDALWKNLYQAISYANNILRNAADPQFSDSRLERIQAEAYGVRALLHLDVYRLFGPMNYEAHKSERLLPYSATFDLANKPVYSNEDFLKQVLADLERAEALMGDDETIRQDAPTATEFTSNRVVHLNKYAVYALYARVYTIMGNAEKALEYADKVIAKFPLATSARFASVKRFPAAGEMVFGLYAPRFASAALTLFSGQTFFGRADLDETIYGTASATAGNRDVRYAAFYRNDGFIGAPEQNKFIRFGANNAEVTGLTTAQRGLTMIRVPEMYYVRAEALYRQGNTTEALDALNAVRSARGLQPLQAAQVTSLDEMKRQIQLEYIKEYPGEGQVFFAFKHLGIAFTDYDGDSQTPTETLFVLPRPESEQNYGNQ